MISAIATVLKSKLVNLPWIERFGGLVNVATRPIVAQGADGVSVVTGYQSYPVACDVNQANCWDNGLFKHFEPDSTKTAVAFFTDNGGVALKSVEGPKNARLKMSFDLKFLCWINLARLGSEFTQGGCEVSGYIAPYVIAQFWGQHTARGLFAGGMEEDIFQEIDVTSVRQLQKTPAMFSPFAFSTDGDKRGLFLYPYDYLGLSVSGTFTININCLPAFFTMPESAYCIPQ